MKLLKIWFILLALLSQQQMVYAFGSGTVWEVETTGSNSNGGGFDTSVSSPGTDESYGAGQVATSYTDIVLGGTATGLASGTYTSGGTVTGGTGTTCILTTFNNSLTGQQVTVALTGSNTIAGGTSLNIIWAGSGASAAPTSATLTNGTATCSGTATISTTLGVTTATSAANPFSATTHGPGNIINVTSGTGCTVQRVEITAQAAGTATFDKALGTAGSTCSGTMGGALGGAANNNIATVFPLAVAGNDIYIKTGTYPVTSAATFNVFCTNAFPCRVFGYGTTRGDNTRATIQAAAVGIGVIADGGNWHQWRNIVFDGNNGSFASTAGFSSATGTDIDLVNIVSKNFSTSGVTLGANSQSLRNSQVTGGATGCTAGVKSSGRNLVENSEINANACPGIQVLTGAGLVALRNLIHDNTGASSDGIQVTIAPGSTSPQLFESNVIYNNGRDGIRGTVAGSFDSTRIYGNIIQKNSGVGVNSTVTTYTDSRSNYNAYWNNGGDTGTTTTHNLTGWTNGTNDVCAAGCGGTISGDPFVNAASGNFALNNTAGAGAVLRAAEFPGAFVGGTTTGYLDIGAAQTQATGGATSFGIVQ